MSTLLEDQATVLITVKLRSETVRKLQDYVRERPSLLNRSQLIRSALEEYLEKHGAKQATGSN